MTTHGDPLPPTPPPHPLCVTTQFPRRLVPQWAARSPLRPFPPLVSPRTAVSNPWVSANCASLILAVCPSVPSASTSAVLGVCTLAPILNASYLVEIKEMVGRNEAPRVTTIHHTKVNVFYHFTTHYSCEGSSVYRRQHSAQLLTKGSRTTRQCRHSYVFVLAKQHVDRTVHRVGSETARLHIGEGQRREGDTALRPISLSHTPLHKLVLLRKVKALLPRDSSRSCLTVDLICD